MKPLYLFLAFLLLPGCSSLDKNNDSDAPSGINISRHAASATPSFGDQYEITTAGEGVSSPALNEGVLTLWVSFSGGCEEHDFVLGKSDSADKITFWFTHKANSDFCEAYLTEKIEVDVSQDLTGEGGVELQNPNGDPFSLR